MAEKQKLTFPVLRASEIAACLTELCGRKIEEHHISQPDAESLLALFELLVERLRVTGGQKDELLPTDIDPQDAFEYPILHTASVPQIIFLDNFMRLMRVVGYETYGLRDLMNPTNPRTIRALSAIINFAKYREEKREAYAALAEEGTQLYLDTKRAEEENARARELLKELQEVVKAEEPERKVLLKQKEELEAIILELNTQQASLKAEKDAYVEQAKEIAAKTQEVQMAIEAEKQKIAKLQSKIIKSPEKVLKYIESLGQTLQKEKALFEETSRSVDDVDIRLQSIEAASKKLDKCVKLLQELEIERTKNLEQKEKIRNQKLKTESEQAILRELQNTQELQTRRLTSATEKLHRLEQQHEQHLVKEQEKREAVRNAKQQLDTETDVMHHKITELQVHLKKLQFEDQQLDAAHERELKKYTDRTEELLRAMRTYNEAFMSVTGSGNVASVQSPL